MNQFILVGAGIIDFHRLLNCFLRAVGFDTALMRNPDEIRTQSKPDDRTAAIPTAALASAPPDGYWMRRNGRYIRLDPTEYRLLRHLSRHPVRAFLRDELVDATWWHGT